MTSQPTDLDALRRRLSDALGGVWSMIVSPPRDPALEEAIAERAAHAAPVVWLIGKVQSGKSSIVRALTGASDAEIGTGFKACTTTASVFDFPADAPVIRFLDTRGLGEAGYDPATDIAFAEGQAHLLLVVTKAMDPAQDAVLETVRLARARHAEWPVLAVQTCLHEAYPPGTGHPQVYPFDAEGTAITDLPGDLVRSLAWQRERVAKLPGSGPIAFAAIDFTQAGDGFTPELYGLDALQHALTRIAPAAVASAIGTPARVALDAWDKRAHPHILGYAAAAAAVDVIPVAGAIAVPGIQGKLLHSLAGIYGVEWDRRMVGEFAGALGAGALARIATSFGARQLGKLIPGYGQTAGAAAAAAMFTDEARLPTRLRCRDRTHHILMRGHAAQARLQTVSKAPSVRPAFGQPPAFEALQACDEIWPLRHHRTGAGVRQEFAIKWRQGHRADVVEPLLDQVGAEPWAQHARHDFLRLPADA